MSQEPTKPTLADYKRLRARAEELREQARQEMREKGNITIDKTAAYTEWWALEELLGTEEYYDLAVRAGDVRFGDDVWADEQ